MPGVQDHVRARLSGRQQDVGDGVLVDADPAQRVAEHLAHRRDTQAFSFEHQTEPNLWALLSLRSHISRDFP